MCALVEKLHAKDPSERVQSAQDIADLFAGRLAHPGEQPQGSAARIAVDRRPGFYWWTLVLSAMGLSAVILAGISMWPWPRWHDGTSSFEQRQPRVGTLPTVTPTQRRITGQLRKFQLDFQVVQLALSPDGRTVAAGTAAYLGTAGPEWTGQCPIVLWDLEAGSEIRRLHGHLNSIRALAFTSDGKRLVSVSHDRQIKTWEIESGRELGNFDVSPSDLRGMDLSPDGERLLAGSSDGIVRLWDVAAGRVVWRCRESQQPAYSVALSDNGTWALIGGDQHWDLEIDKWTPGSDHALRLWNMRTDSQRRLEGHAGFVTCVAISHDGRRALSGSYDNTVRLWDLETCQERRCFPEHHAIVQAVAISPDGRRGLSAGGDWTIRLWDLDSGRERYAFVGHQEAVRCVVFSQDGGTAISGDGTGVLRYWQLPQ
jgi:WD40 repeat protein